MAQKRKRIAIVGAGVAGLTCAKLLAREHDVEIFESSGKGCASRPLQMEGAVHYLDNIPDLRPTHTLKKLTLASRNESVTLMGDLGFLYRVGGTDGVDANLRKEVGRRVKMHHSARISELDALSGFDVVIAADGYRSRIALLAGMRGERAECNGIGLGLTVKGDFEVGTTYSLFDEHYAPGGYLYLIPMTERRASLVSASIGTGINARVLAGRLRDYAQAHELEVIDGWADIEKWYRFNAYHKGNVYLVGSAASLYDRTYGFGLKYSIQSAVACAEAITTGKSYHRLLQPVLKELDYWSRVGGVLVNTTNEQKDRFVRMVRNPLVRRWIESGRSLRPFFGLAARYLTIGRKVWTAASRNPLDAPQPVCAGR